MTVEELEREFSSKYNENTNLVDQQQRPIPMNSEHITPEMQNFFQQKQRFHQQPPDISGMNPMAAAAMMHHAAFLQQNMIAQQEQQRQQKEQQQHSLIRHPMLQKLLSNASNKSLVYIVIFPRSNRILQFNEILKNFISLKFKILYQIF